MLIYLDDIAKMEEKLSFSFSAEKYASTNTTSKYHPTTNIQYTSMFSSVIAVLTCVTTIVIPYIVPAYKRRIHEHTISLIWA